MNKQFEIIKRGKKTSLYRIHVLLFLLLCLPSLTFSQKNIIHLGISQHEKDSAQDAQMKIIDPEINEFNRERKDTIAREELPGFVDYLFFYLFTPRYYLHVYHDFTRFNRRQRKLH